MASLFGVLLITFYRNFGIPVVRIWPLIWIDTFLRVPGDVTLGVLNPNIPAGGYEAIRALSQFMMSLLVLWGIWMILAGLSRRQARKRMGASPQNGPRATPTGGKWAGWALIAVSILFWTPVITVRFSRQTVDMLSFLTGVRGYDLYVMTEVGMEGAGRKLAVDHYFSAERTPLIPTGETSHGRIVRYQDSLLARHKKGMPLVRPGKIRFIGLPPGIREKDAMGLERRALDFLNALSDLPWMYQADARLTFSPDGKRATYDLELSSVDGPLAGIGEGYAIEFENIEQTWCVVKMGMTYLWIS